MDNKRQAQISKLLQRVLGNYIQKHGASLFQSFVTVTEVTISKDLQFCKVYLSIFLSDDKEKTLALVKEHKGAFRKLVATECSQLRVVPEFQFILDDSLDYVEHIEQLLKT
jgi:ribosome-binding factor A